jgi:hypothetical protein
MQERTELDPQYTSSIESDRTSLGHIDFDIEAGKRGGNLVGSTSARRGKWPTLRPINRWISPCVAHHQRRLHWEVSQDPPLSYIGPTYPTHWLVAAGHCHRGVVLIGVGEGGKNMAVNGTFKGV